MRLWVKETWAVTAPIDQVRREHDDALPPLDFHGPYYRADGDERHGPGLRWVPSIHMPRWASRITLEVVAVRVERLQEITPEDVSAEGAPADWGCLHTWYSDLWDSINAKRGYSWEINPWVWVVSFRKEAKC